MPHLTTAQARLQDDLRGLIDGDVRCDRVALSLYATDASPYAARPAGVVWPRGTDDVVACVQYAAEKQISIHARGAGTGTTGGSLGNGIVLDFTRYMRRLVRYGEDSVTVQPGANRLRVNDILMRKQDRIYGPDPGTAATATLGGILASDGAGPHWLRYGSPRDTLLGLTVVLADGEVLKIKYDTLPTASESATSELGRRFVDPSRSGMPDADVLTSSADESIARKVAMARGIVHGRGHQLADELFRILAAVPRETLDDPRRLPVDTCGYHLEGVILRGKRNIRVNLPRLFCGSEGTLGIITEMRLRTTERPRHTGSALLGFGSLEKAVRAVEAVLPHRPSLCELIDRRCIALLTERDRRFSPLFPRTVEAALLIEADDPYPLGLTDRLNDMVVMLRRPEYDCIESRLFLDHAEQALLDELLEKLPLAFASVKGNVVTLPLLDDLAVATDRLAPVVFAIQNVFKRYEAIASFGGHVGHGHLRVQPILDRNRPHWVGTLKKIVEEINDEVLRCGGTLTSERVGGLGRSRFIAKQVPALYPAFVKVKTLFDPDRILNPGKIIGDGLPWTAHLRTSYRSLIATDEGGNSAERASVSMSESLSEPLSAAHEPELLTSQLELQLKWSPADFSETTRRCNGCGRCRSRLKNARMCPVFRVLPDESASPRSTANLMRDILEGELPLETLTSEASVQVADYCIHCQSCRWECPAEVDIPHLAFRCKSAYVAAHGMPVGDRLLSNIDPIMRVLCLISCPVNWMFRNRTMRWILEKSFGLPQERRIPPLSKVSFLTRLQWTNRRVKPSHEPGRKVALFLDTYGNLYDSRLTDAAIKVLQHNGIGVYVPPRQRTAGLFAFACGDQYHAEILARRNTAIFVDAIRQGYDVVALESSSAHCLSREYRYLRDDADSRLLAENVTDFCTYLHRLHGLGELNTSFRSLPWQRIGYHAPCRTLALANVPLDAPTPAEELLRLIPGLDVRRLEKGCCGLAGNYGFQIPHYRTSLRIGMDLFKALRDPEIALGASECCTCKMQMEQAVAKPIVHPAKLLAAAYGLISPSEEKDGDPFGA